MLSYIPGKHYHFSKDECEDCPQNDGLCDICGDADRLLAEIRDAVMQFKDPRLMSLYWKIEREVRPQSVPDYRQPLLNQINKAVRTINIFHVDSAPRKKIVNYYNKIEQEVLNGKRN